jgi:hypothetical protein
MKHFPLFLALLLCLMLPANAKPAHAKRKKARGNQAAVRLTALPGLVLNAKGIILDVADAGSDRQSWLNKNDGWYGDEKIAATTRRNQSLKINLRNGTADSRQPTVEWFFIALNIGSGHQRLFSSGSRDMDLAANGTATTDATSREIQSTHLAKNGQSSARGMIMAGWIVRVVEDDEVLAQQCSDHQTEDLTHDAARLAKLQTPLGLAP